MEVRETQVINDPRTGSQSVQEATHHVISPTEAQAARAEKKNQFIWYIVGLVDIVLALRFVFLLLGARDLGFTQFLYSVSDPLVAPFQGIFPAHAAGGYFDTAALMAIVIYALLGWAVAALLDLFSRPA